MKPVAISILTILAIPTLWSSLQGQTVVQQKVVGNQYWRITKNVTLSELNRELFGQCANTIQLTFEDINIGKKMMLKFATDENWHRLLYGDFNKWMKSYGEAGIGSAQFQKPTAIDIGTYYVPGIGQRTELFIADYFNNRVQVLRVNLRFSGSGGSGDTDVEFVGSLNNMGSIGDLCVMTIDGCPYLVVTQTNTHRISFYDLSTGNYTYRNTYGALGSGTSQFNSPVSLDGIKNSWLSTKSIFVQDYGNNRIVRLIPSRNTDGTVSLTWSSTMGYQYRLTSLATDYGGNLWITDSTNNRLLKYDNNFNFLSSYGTSGSGQISGLINGPRSFSTGTYMIKDAVGTTVFKNDVSFLAETWSDQSGGIAYDLGVDMTALSVSGPSSLIGTIIAYFVTDWSWIYVTVEKQSGSSWGVVKTFGYPINGVSGQVVPSGSNSFTWDGRDGNGILQGPGTYRITAYGREFYEDPDAPTVSRQVTYVPPLTGSISGPSSVNYGQTYTWNASGSGGTSPSYTWEWYKGNTYVGNTSYLTTSLTSNTTLVLKVRSGADQISVTKSVTVGSGGGGCPFVLAETQYGFEPDNNLLHRSESPANKGRDIQDLYALRVKPKEDGQSYRLQVREYNEDYSYFDQFNLFYVDHSDQTEIGVTEQNQIVTYDRSLLVAPTSVAMNDGRTYDGAGNKGDVMRLQFSKTSVAKISAVVTDNNSGLALLLDLERPVGLLPPGKGGGGAITVMRGDGLGKTASSNAELGFSWRVGNSVVLVPVTQDLDLEEVVINWTRDYAIKSLGLVPIEVVKAPTKLELSSAKHSRRGDVLDRLVSSDKKYAELDAGDFIDLTFKDNSRLEGSATRDLIFSTVGRYVVPSNGEAAIPTEFGLDQNYPNPFNPTTDIRYYLPENSRVTLKVYNLLGQEVRTLVNGFENAGIKTVNWDGRNSQGHRAASGIYIYKMSTSSFTKARKLMLLK